MFYKRKGLPEEGDIVSCTVKNILHHSVFVTVDEFDNLEGLIHISELAPGRIRNIRDYVTPNKKIVCKVLRVNIANRHVDLSLRRVPLNTKKLKDEFSKQELKSEKLLESVGKQLKITLEEMYNKAGGKIIESYGSLTECFQEVVSKGEKPLLDLQIDSNMAKVLAQIIQEKIQPKQIKIESVLEIECPKPNGITIIKELLTSIEHKKNNNEIKISYISAPKYRVQITSDDYKSAEKTLKEITENLEKETSKKGGKFSCQKRS